MAEKFNVEYIPGGAAQNTARVAQVGWDAVVLF